MQFKEGKGQIIIQENAFDDQENEYEDKKESIFQRDL